MSTISTTEATQSDSGGGFDTTDKWTILSWGVVITIVMFFLLIGHSIVYLRHTDVIRNTSTNTIDIAKTKRIGAFFVSTVFCCVLLNWHLFAHVNNPISIEAHISLFVAIFSFAVWQTVALSLILRYFIYGYGDNGRETAIKWQNIVHKYSKTCDIMLAAYEMLLALVFIAVQITLWQTSPYRDGPLMEFVEHHQLWQVLLSGGKYLFGVVPFLFVCKFGGILAFTLIALSCFNAYLHVNAIYAMIWFYFSSIVVTTMLLFKYSPFLRDRRSFSLFTGGFLSVLDTVTDITVVIVWFRNGDYVWAALQLSAVWFGQIYGLMHIHRNSVRVLPHQLTITNMDRDNKLPVSTLSDIRPLEVDTTQETAQQLTDESQWDMIRIASIVAHSLLMLAGLGRIWYAVCAWIEYYFELGSLPYVNPDSTRGYAVEVSKHRFQTFTQYTDIHLSYKILKVWEMVFESFPSLGLQIYVAASSLSTEGRSYQMSLIISMTIGIASSSFAMLSILLSDRKKIDDDDSPTNDTFVARQLNNLNLNTAILTYFFFFSDLIVRTLPPVQFAILCSNAATLGWTIAFWIFAFALICVEMGMFAFIAKKDSDYKTLSNILRNFWPSLISAAFPLLHCFGLKYLSPKIDFNRWLISHYIRVTISAILMVVTFVLIYSTAYIPYKPPIAMTVLIGVDFIINLFCLRFGVQRYVASL